MTERVTTGPHGGDHGGNIGGAQGDAGASAGAAGEEPADACGKAERERGVYYERTIAFSDPQGDW
jgi:hypothetical protein